MDALVTDADLVGAVAGLRGLARAGRRVAVLGPQRSAAGLLSRHAALRAVGPDAGLAPEAFAARVGELAAAHGPLVVYPSREESIDALLTQPLPPEARLPYPGAEPVNLLRDKRRLPELAAAAGLRAPATIAEGTAGELRAATGLATPAVVKPVARGPGLPDVTLARTPGELAEQLAAIPDDAAVMLQEPAAGPLICLAVVLDRDGRVVDRFQQRALRVWPTPAGAVASGVGVAPDEDLCAATARMLTAAGYWGLAQLDILMTPDGPRVIDVNPRFYISLRLANASGTNLAGAWHDVVLGEGRHTPAAYRVGIGYRRLASDFSAAVRGQPRLLLDRPRRPVVGSVWLASDPLPGLVVAGARIADWLLNRVGPRPTAEPARPLTVSVAPFDASDPALAAEWRGLEAGAPAPPYLCWDWLRAWQSAYRPGVLRVLRIADGGEPVALALLERTAFGRWRFAGAPVSPVRALLVRPADEDAAWRALGDWLARRRRGWAMLTMEGVPTAAAALPRARLHEASTWRIALPGSFDAYLAERSASQRKGHKQKLRRLIGAGGEVTLVAPEERADALRAFVELHRARAAAKGEVHDQIDERLVALLEGVADSDSVALRLFALRVDGKLAGVSVRADRDEHRTAWFYNAGFDEEYGRLGPGVTLELHSIMDAIERGHEIFDLGPGFWRYKRDLGGTERLLQFGAAFAPSPRGLAMRAAVGIRDARARRRADA